jgi:hypothetical protein
MPPKPGKNGSKQPKTADARTDDNDDFQVYYFNALDSDDETPPTTKGRGKSSNKGNPKRPSK